VRRPLATVMRHALMRTALCILFLVGFLAAPTPTSSQSAVNQQEIEQHKIQYLISTIADLKDAKFIRNGSEYDAQRAADHLRLKLHYAGDRVKTAEDFIVYCATGSSMSSEKYRIKFSDGLIVDAAVFLRDKLVAYPALQLTPHPS